MKPQTSIEHLLRWRAAQAEADAPPPPRAARLLELARPWWEVWPERFRAAADRVNGMKFVYGHAATAATDDRGGYPVPVVLLRQSGEREASARVLFLSVREGRLRLRLQLDAGPENDAARFEATFLSDGHALFDAAAIRSMDSEYRIDTEIAPALETAWGALRVADRMPFRLILRLS